MQQEGARITTSESVLFQLLGHKGHPLFKELSKLNKERHAIPNMLATL